MIGTRRHRAAFAAALTLLLVDCGGSLPLSSSLDQRTASWMLPSAGSSNLLYVADSGTNVVDVYSYPQGVRAGRLTGFESLAFLCADKAGNVFVPDFGAHEILKYAHGGTKPIAKLSDSNDKPYSCSVDSKTGNLAVANYGTNSGSGNSISIYVHARGSPKFYDIGYPDFIAYDGSGNLYVESYSRGSQGSYFRLVRLAKGGRTFETVTLDQIPAFPNGMQWNGDYLAIGTGTNAGPSSGDTYIYQVKIEYRIGKTVGTTHLVETALTNNFFIQGATIIVTGGNPAGRTKFFPYPGGGSPTKSLTESAPAGVVVSVAARK